MFLDRSTTGARIANALRDRIASGEYAQGARLNELQLTKALGVCRNTLREAISILVGEGLLTRSSFKGVQVTRLTPDDIRDVFAARRSIELSAVSALEHAPEPVVKHLLACIEKVVAGKGTLDSQSMDSADTEVHIALVAAHGSKRLSAMFVSLLRELHILYFNAYEKERTTVTTKAHEVFAQLVRAGDYRAAREQLEQRLLRSEAEMVTVMQNAAHGGTASPAKARLPE